MPLQPVTPRPPQYFAYRYGGPADVTELEAFLAGSDWSVYDAGPRSYRLRSLAGERVFGDDEVVVFERSAAGVVRAVAKFASVTAMQQRYTT